MSNVSYDKKELPPITVTHDKPMYGVWIKNKGWLRANDEQGKEFGDYSLDKARQVAKLIGGTVRYIDKSLIDLEPQFLHKERRSLWDMFLNWLQHKINILHSSKTTKIS